MFWRKESKVIAKIAQKILIVIFAAVMCGLMWATRALAFNEPPHEVVRKALVGFVVVLVIGVGVVLIQRNDWKANSYVSRQPQVPGTIRTG
jgi:hypothetical protein